MSNWPEPNLLQRYLKAVEECELTASRINAYRKTLVDLARDLRADPRESINGIPPHLLSATELHGLLADAGRKWNDMHELWALLTPNEQGRVQRPIAAVDPIPVIGRR